MNKKDLLNKIKTLDTLSKDEKAILVELLNAKKYGLVWENKPETVEELLRQNLPILKEVKEKYIKGTNTPQIPTNDLFPITENTPTTPQTSPNHLLIEGDNLHALTALSFTHENKIDVIYIDPPYNTGNKDFKYNDSFVDKEDTYRHSKWLSFMSKRLQIAKKLLNENGVIFISIDDNEQSQLKMLCDEIFGEKNFVADLIRKTKSMTGDEGSGVNIQHENLILFAKNKANLFLAGEEKNFSAYKNPDNDINGDWTSGDPSAKSGGASTFFEIKNPFNNHIDLPPNDRFWAFSKKTLQEYIANGKILFKEDVKNNERGFIFKRYKKDLKSKFNPVGSLLFIENGFMNQVGTKELKLILNKEIFSNPKPSEFIKKIILYSTSPSAIILDFFAGSGTTLHATMQLNAEDGGNRQCVLVTNNENNICEDVTYERNKRVIEGYTNAKGVFVEGLGNNHLRYYQCGFVSRSEEIKYKKELVLGATDLLCIKENCYELSALSTPTDLLRVYVSEKSQFLVIYDEDEISTSIEIIKQLQLQKQNDNPIKVYVFANGHYPFTEDFEEVLEFITLCALPDAIYKALQNVLPSQEGAILGLEEENNELGDLFSSGS